MEFINSSPFITSPSFLRGVARTMDLTGTLKLYKTDKKADITATKRDWSLVGKFLYSAILDYGHRAKTKTKK